MFECKGLSDKNVCIAMPHLGRLHGSVCEECKGKGLGECRYIKHGRDREGCDCYYVDCQNPDCPVYGVVGPQISRHCNARKCKYFKQEYQGAGLMISLVIPHRQEEPDLLRMTVESFRLAGADEIIEVDDSEGHGPAWGRNRGAIQSSGNVVVWTDAHCKWIEGDFRKFASKAIEKNAIVCAPTSSMDQPEKFTAYGADLTPDEEVPGFRLSPHLRPRETSPALYGSVYAMSWDTYKKLGGWPATISWGYNEQGLSMAANSAGVPILVATDCRILHKFRKKIPYTIRGLDPLVNRMIIHHMFESPEDWEMIWKPQFEKESHAWRRFQRYRKMSA